MLPIVCTSGRSSWIQTFRRSMRRLWTSLSTRRTANGRLLLSLFVKVVWFKVVTFRVRGSTISDQYRSEVSYRPLKKCQFLEISPFWRAWRCSLISKLSELRMLPLLNQNIGDLIHIVCVFSGAGVDSIGEFYLAFSDAGGGFSHDEQVQRRVPWCPLLWWQRVRPLSSQV